MHILNINVEGLNFGGSPSPTQFSNDLAEIESQNS